VQRLREAVLLFAVGVTSVAAPALSAAQQDARRDTRQDTLYLSLRDAASAGRERSPVSLGAAARARSARAQVGTVQSQLLPQIALDASHVTESYSRQQLGLAAPNLGPPTLPPVLGPFQDQDVHPSFTVRLLDIATFERVHVASTSATAAAYDSLATGDDNADSAARAYIALAASASFVRLRVRLALLTDSLLTDARARYQARIAGVIDVIRARAESVTAVSNVTRALRDQDQGRTTLLRLIEQPMDRPVQLTDTLGLPPAAEDSSDDAMVVAALESRPEVHAEEARLAAARYSLRAAHDEWLPTVEAQGQYGFDGRWLIGGGPNDPVVRTQVLRVGARWDVFDGGRREYGTEIGRQGVLEASARLRDRTDRIEGEVRNAAIALRAERALAVDADGTARLEEQELRDVTALYLRGLATSTDLTDAETRYIDAQTAVVNSLLTYNEARLALLRAVERLDTL
jgi:outer membrane protein